MTGSPSCAVTDDRIPRRAALLGSGVIGAGWAARLLLSGVDVALYDPAPEAAETARAALERARRSWSRLTLVTPPAPGTLTLAGSVAEAVAGAELVQESAPEREPLKLDLLARACEAAPADAIIASSTSGLLPSRISSSMAHPERFLVAHPFNPVYLLPLVELCGGSRTSPETIERAASLYRALGMHPLVVRQEIDGFIADRLLEAVWREALWLVHDGVATAEEIDDALRYGPGLRWSTMGTFLIYRLAGGTDGMRHFLAQFGPTLQLPWSRLTDVPRLDDALLDTLVAQSDAQAAGRSIEELARVRDDCLVAVLSGLRGEAWGAGNEVAATERRWQRTALAATDGLVAARDGLAPGDGRLYLHEVIVAPEWIDYNGHMTEFRYLEVLADTTDVFLPTDRSRRRLRRGGQLVLHRRDAHPPFRRGTRGGSPQGQHAAAASRLQATAPVPRDLPRRRRRPGRDRRAHAAARRPDRWSRGRGGGRGARRARADRSGPARAAPSRRRRPRDWRRPGARVDTGLTA